ncbi:MAG: NnrS family protein [Rhizobiales bacterium]|nr:NnrS family protein [Hyphomicrobiales bacterium]
MITLVGGRVTPSFTRNWLNKAGSKNLPAQFGVPDKIALVATLVAVASWVAAPFNEISGGLVLLATAAQAIRLSRWQGHRCLSEPLVLALHVGYAWLILGLGLLGTAIMFDTIPQSAALHGLTVGMIGTMTLAVMTRATLGHSGQPLRADLATQTIFVLVVCAALTRVMAPLMGEDYLFYLMLAGGLWIATFSLFVIRYLPLWTRK